MQIYLAPMQSVTGYVFRNAYHKHFCDVDKYFTPFLADRRIGTKDKNEILPEHNIGMQVVPQILTNRSDVFLEIAQQLQTFGYDTVNLNLGCPSGTVVAKKRGAGLLGYPEELRRFLDEIFEKCRLKISVKTRIGIESEEEWEVLWKLYREFPMEELIIHPRLQKDQYGNVPRVELFKVVQEESVFPLCYNGDIHSKAQYESFVAKIGREVPVMLGRGMIKNPGLAGEIRGKERISLKVLRRFHDDLLAGYCEVLCGDTNILFKMKEVWGYLGAFFLEMPECEEAEKALKKIRKCKTLAEYKGIINGLF